jgi:hypothetical protein
MRRRLAALAALTALLAAIPAAAHANAQPDPLGDLLMGLAVERCEQARQSVGGYALIVDAKGEAAKSFYSRYGFRPYLDTPNSLCLPLVGPP